MSADTVPAEESVEEANAVEQPVAIEEQKEEQVPLKVLKKERKKRQEAELKAQWNEQRLQELMNSQPKQEDMSQYENVTKGELKNYSQQERQQIIQQIKEEDWMKSNPEKIDIIDEKLPELLKQKPHLSYAIMHSTNRYEEAWEQLMGHSKVNMARQQPVRKESKAPGSPANMPKSAGVNQAVDLMKLSDAEFNEWRKQQRRRR